MPHSPLPQDIRPVFVIGAPRSGTSITAWTLGQHPNIQLMPETCWIASMAAGGYVSHGYGSNRGRFSHLSNVELPLGDFMRRLGAFVDQVVNDCFVARCERRYGDYRATGRLGTAEGRGAADGFALLNAPDDPKRRWVDATPLNTHFAWALAQMFPHARFIHNLRRPEHVATSLKGFDRFGHAPLELEEGLRTWMAHTEHAWQVERWVGAQRAFRLDFARLSAEPEALVADVLRFLDEPFHAPCLTPLGTRINSSEVDDRRDVDAVGLGDNEVFRQARALYAEVLARPPSDVLDPDAGEALREHFVRHCAHHPLL